MFTTTIRRLSSIAVTLLAICSSTATRAEVLGPLDPGAEAGSYPTAYWFNNGVGAGYVNTHDPSNPYSGSYDFKLGNTAASTPFTGGNYADFRSLAFSLGPAAHGSQTVSLAFAFELPGVVGAGDNILVQLLFYQGYGNNGEGDVYVGEYGVNLGSDSGHSAMTNYALFTHGGIVAPATAEYASVRFSANIFSAWSSGTAFFDDISVTTEATAVPEIDPSAMGGALALCAGVLAAVERRRRPHGR